MDSNTRKTIITAMRYNRTCKFCHQDFDTDKLTKCVCDECKTRPQHRICKWCGKISSTEGSSQYCSNECRHLAISETKKTPRPEQNPNFKYERRCPICENTFVTNRSDKVFCSSQCRSTEMHRRVLLGCKPYIYDEGLNIFTLTYADYHIEKYGRILKRDV